MDSIARQIFLLNIMIRVTILIVHVQQGCTFKVKTIPFKPLYIIKRLEQEIVGNFGIVNALYAMGL